MHNHAANAQASLWAGLPLEAKIVLGIAGLLIALSLGVSRGARIRRTPPAEVGAQHGAAVELAVSGAAYLSAVLGAMVLIVADVEPVLLALLLATFALLPAFIASSALVRYGRQRAWIWTIRIGDVVQRRLFAGLVLILIGVAVARFLVGI